MGIKLETTNEAVFKALKIIRNNYEVMLSIEYKYRKTIGLNLKSLEIRREVINSRSASRDIGITLLAEMYELLSLMLSQSEEILKILLKDREDIEKQKIVMIDKQIEINEGLQKDLIDGGKMSEAHKLFIIITQELKLWYRDILELVNSMIEMITQDVKTIISLKKEYVPVVGV